MSHWYDSTPKKSRRKRDSNPGSSALEVDALTTRPTRRSKRQTDRSVRHGEKKTDRLRQRETEKERRTDRLRQTDRGCV